MTPRRRNRRLPQARRAAAGGCPRRAAWPAPRLLAALLVATLLAGTLSCGNDATPPAAPAAPSAHAPDTPGAARLPGTTDANDATRENAGPGADQPPPPADNNTAPRPPDTTAPTSAATRLRLVYQARPLPAGDLSWQAYIDAPPPGTDFDLVVAALLLARAYYRPPLPAGSAPDAARAPPDIAATLRAIDTVARGIAREFAGEPVEVRTLLARLTFALFARHRLRSAGDLDARGLDPNVLHLPGVLEYGVGNCLSLTVLVLGVLDRLGVGNRFALTDYPNHVTVRFDDGHERLIYEPTAAGACSTDAAYAALFELTGDGMFGRDRSRREAFAFLLSNLAIQRERSGDAADALRLLDRAVALYPDQPQIRFNRGGVRVATGTPGGIGDLVRSLALWPKNAGAYLQLAKAYRDAGTPARARAVLERGTALGALLLAKPSVALEVGRTQQDEGHLDAAIATFRAALESSPAAGTLWYALGLALWDAKQPAAARRALNSALTHAVDDAERAGVHRALAQFAIESGDDATAVTHLYALVRQFEPENPTLWKNLGLLLMRRVVAARQAAVGPTAPQTRPQTAPQTAPSALATEAVAALRTAARLADDLDVRLALADYFLQKPDLDAASAEVGRALALGPADAVALRIAARIALAQRDFAVADRLVTRGLALKAPEDRRDFQPLLARLRLAEGKPKAALAALEAYVKAGGTEPRVRAWRKKLAAALAANND